MILYRLNYFVPPGVESKNKLSRYFEDDLTGYIAIRYYHIPPALYPWLQVEGNFSPKPCKSRYNKPLMSCYAV